MSLPSEIRLHGNRGEGKAVLARAGKPDVDLSDLLHIIGAEADVRVGSIPVVKLVVLARLVHVESVKP